MSGVQAVTYSFETAPAARVAPVQTIKPAEGVREKQPESSVPGDVNKEEKKFDFSKISEEDKKKLEDRLSKLNDSLATYGKLLRFKYNEDAKQTYVEVLDSQTQEVLVSLPPEFLIELSVRIKEMIGIFLDKKL